MEYIPPELLIKIFSFLDPVSIVNCRQVCQRWRILSVKMVNPLYLPQIFSGIMQRLNQDSSCKLRDLLKTRLVCKLWKDGLDKLTLHEKLFLKGLTTINDNHGADELNYTTWNPFPSRIIRLKLCSGHDDPDNDRQQLENVEENLMIERFGTHVSYLQVHLQHADCAEKHLRTILNNLLETLQGLIITECVSPHRFSEKKKDTAAESTEISCSDGNQLGCLKKLKFLKLDDSDCKLQYSEFYKQIIENAPNLQHLEINGYRHLDIGIHKLLAHRNSGSLSLTHLKIDAETSHLEEILEILEKSTLALKYLSLKILGHGDAAQCATATRLLHSALQKFSCTLERLELKLSWYENEAHPKPELLYVFPSSKFLTKVKRFKLVGFRGQLDFLKDFVALKYLMVVDFNPQSQETFISDQSFHQLIPNLKQLHLPLQASLYTADWTYKKKLQHFMYDGDERFDQKYCGLYQEIFP